MKGMTIRFVLPLLFWLGASDQVAALAGGALDSATAPDRRVDTPVEELYCDYALTPNDQPRKVFMEVDVVGGVTQIQSIGGLLHFTCSCSVAPSGCYYIPTETVFDIQPDGTRTVSANQCSPRKVLIGSADGSTTSACPSVLRPFTAVGSEITNYRWNEILYGSYAEGVLLDSWDRSITANLDPYLEAADLLCKQGCNRIAGIRQTLESFMRCGGMAPQSFISRGGFCPGSN